MTDKARKEAQNPATLCSFLRIRKNGKRVKCKLGQGVEREGAKLDLLG